MSRPDELVFKARFGPNHNDALNELASRLETAEAERDAAVEALRRLYKMAIGETLPDEKLEELLAAAVLAEQEKEQR